MFVPYSVGFVTLYDGKPGEGAFSLPDISTLRSNESYLMLVVAGFFIGASILAMLGYIVIYIEDELGRTMLVGGAVLALTHVMGTDVPETRVNSGDDHTRLLALLNDYGISERLQRLLALQLAGGCTRTENGKAVRGEINLQLVVDPIVDQTGLLELVSGLTPNSTTINGTDVSFGGLFTVGRSLLGVTEGQSAAGITDVVVTHPPKNARLKSTNYSAQRHGSDPSSRCCHSANCNLTDNPQLEG